MDTNKKIKESLQTYRDILKEGRQKKDRVANNSSKDPLILLREKMKEKNPSLSSGELNKKVLKILANKLEVSEEDTSMTSAKSDKDDDDVENLDEDLDLGSECGPGKNEGMETSLGIWEAINNHFVEEDEKRKNDIS